MDDQKLQQLIFFSSFVNKTAPLNLSKGKSINLAQVSSYEAVEKLDEKEKPTGELLPLLQMQNGDQIELTKEENDIFRPVWNTYTEANAMVIELLQSLLTANRAAALADNSNQQEKQ